MGARHVNQLSSLLKAEAGRRYFVTKVTKLYRQHGSDFTSIQGIDINQPSQTFELRPVLRALTVVAKMSVQSLPGCCGVCVLHSFSGETKHVVEFIKVGIRAAKRAGYGQVLFTLAPVA